MRPSTRGSYTFGRAPLGGVLRDKEQRKTMRGAYLKSLKYAVSLIWSVRRAYIILNVIGSALAAAESVVLVLIMQYIVNAAMDGVPLTQIIGAAAIYIAFEAAYHAFSAWLERNYNVETEDLIRSAIQLRLHEQTRNIELAAFDTKEFYDDYARALDVLDERIIKCFKNLISVATCVMSVGALGSTMITLSPGLILIVLAGCAITIIGYTARSRYTVARNRAITPLMRRFQYLNDLYYQRRFAKDMRIERIDDIAKTDHERCTKELSEEDRKWGSKQARAQFLGRMGTIFADAAMFIYLAAQVVLGHMQAGTFMALWTAAVQFSNALTQLSRALPDLGETLLLIADVRWLDEEASDSESKEKQEGSKKIGSPNILSFDDVRFSYMDGSEILHSVSFSAERGKMLAIVGHNGAGKSTVAKLICGLYSPDSGDISIDGISYESIDRDELHENIAVVHQDYEHYAYSIAQNILMRPISGKEDLKLVRHVLDKVGLLEKVNGFEEGIMTSVTKEFSETGELFSGGELQRLAIARAMAKQAPIIILDEPSSALDPIAEREMIDLMEELFEDRICVVISHRLSMTRDADCILVMHGGSIVEAGDHQRLLESEGAYSKIWRAQAEKYYANEEGVQAKEVVSDEDEAA